MGGDDIATLARLGVNVVTQCDVDDVRRWLVQGIAFWELGDRFAMRFRFIRLPGSLSVAQSHLHNRSPPFGHSVSAYRVGGLDNSGTLGRRGCRPNRAAGTTPPLGAGDHDARGEPCEFGRAYNVWGSRLGLGESSLGWRHSLRDLSPTHSTVQGGAMGDAKRPVSVWPFCLRCRLSFGVEVDLRVVV